MKNFTKLDIPDAKAQDKKTESLKKAFEPINSELYAVEQRIRAEAKAFNPAVEGYVAYAIESSGKRLRPALALLSGGATGRISPLHLELAVIVELIHAATLVHDDIIDGADKRRGQPSVNSKWGNTLSVLLGDCLFAHALKLASGFPSSEVMRRIATAASDVCSGEIIQTQRRFDMKLSVADYYQIIGMKTGALFALATELGAFLNEVSPTVIASMRAMGMKLGTAYQVYDDVIDIAGDEAKVGKTLGSDLRRGKLTLPVLYLLQGASASEREKLCDTIVNGSDDDLDALSERAVRGGAVKNAIETGRRMIDEAQADLNAAPANRYREALSQLLVTLDGMFETVEI